MHDSTSENPTQSAFDFDALANQPVDDVVLHVNPAPPQKGNYWWSDLEHHRIPKKPGIYAIVNRRNQHFYIGSAKNLKDRKNHHFLDLKAGNHKNDHLQRAYNLYGSNAFLFVIVERVEYFEDLISREQHFIDTLNPHYNIARTAGSCLGTTCSPETKAKMSAARRAHPKMLEQMEKLHADRRGKPLSNEHRAKISVVQVGRSLPDEHKSNISDAHKCKKKTH